MFLSTIQGLVVYLTYPHPLFAGAISHISLLIDTLTPLLTDLDVLFYACIFFILAIIGSLLTPLIDCLLLHSLPLRRPRYLVIYAMLCNVVIMPVWMLSEARRGMLRVI
ncbi:hypothetical protein DPSP01_010949 [Paraphaeosphaeria sporulosa]|uniref:Uncharacterized protein n=1 Tax=Paraphaeosphaeria sporulosa TaxID=1460663 RepID=A0A177CB55_9PLEO|nr:uncharacterized protein CC84DRAFT_1261085 [Paraphaeosphaeria sporulosa]OAG04079.1 hypothetical protein CC84DRAFT_1261085 [Paraphaeosphaeria sporulosa]